MRRGQGKSGRRGGPLPRIWLMTDPRVAEADLMRAIRRLPAGAAIILRHYELDPAARHVLFRRIRRLARPRRVLLLLAGDPAMARIWGADGHHGRQPRPAGRRRWLHSAPAHDRHELAMAHRAGADIALLSPLFATRSHPGAPSLGVVHFAALARRAPLPVVALGGVRPRHAALVRRLGAIGYAAIDGLIRRR